MTSLVKVTKQNSENTVNSAPLEMVGVSHPGLLFGRSRRSLPDHGLPVSFPFLRTDLCLSLTGFDGEAAGCIGGTQKQQLLESPRIFWCQLPAPLKILYVLGCSLVRRVLGSAHGWTCCPSRLLPSVSASASAGTSAPAPPACFGCEKPLASCQ